MTLERSTLLWSLLYHLDNDTLSLSLLQRTLIELIRQELKEAGEIKCESST